MKKLFITLLFAITILTYAAESPVDEAIHEGLQYENNGQSITITKYTGNDTSLIIPAEIQGLTVTGIGYRAFQGCENLESITIPGGITSINGAVFYDCSGLKAINVVPDNPAFSSENGVLYNKDKTVLILCPRGFTGSLLIPNSVTDIWHGFYNCNSLTGVTIPNSVTFIMPGGGNADSGPRPHFSTCTSLTVINVAPDNPVFSSENNVFFNKDKTRLIDYPGGKYGSYTIPNSVNTIGYEAFYGHTNLIGIIIPNSVKEIEWSVFSGCTNLTSVTFQGTDLLGVRFSGDYYGFHGDLRAKYLEGGAGTYTRDSGGTVWTKQ